MSPRLLLGCLLLGSTLAFGGNPDQDPGKLLTLSTGQAKLRFEVACLDRSAGERFVRVEIIEVINPGLVPLAFEVHYRPPAGEAIQLGGFALFPPDQPGRFIVPTQGRLRGEGEILLLLEPLPDTPEARSVRVRLREPGLAYGRD